MWLFTFSKTKKKVTIYFILIVIRKIVIYSIIYYCQAIWSQSIHIKDHFLFKKKNCKQEKSWKLLEREKAGHSLWEKGKKWKNSRDVR